MTVSVVTGSSTGIGRAAALRLARDGNTVVATMRTPETNDLKDEAAKEGLELDIRALDVNDQASVDAAFKGIYADHGRIDVLVNNAGIALAKPVEELTLDDYAQVMETNFYGVLRCTKAVLPSMREQGGGAISTVTSQAGRIAFPLMTPYTASKFAIEAALEGLAIEVANHNIRVTIIEPGMILTPIWTKVEPTTPEGPYAQLIGRLLQTTMREFAGGSSAEEVADCIAESITTQEPKLRWLVGHGAERNVRNRAAWGDEGAIRVWNQPDDEKFLDEVFFAE
jgi:NAD(P)-dependent dehydrogenase (short-subunit alcohol dehydrogenase family)